MSDLMENESAVSDGITKESSRNARVLFNSTLAAVALACAYYGVTAKVADPLHLYEGLAILALAAVPGLIWAKGGGKQLPLFEVFLLTTANAYAFPMLHGHESLRRFPPESLTYAGLSVIMFQLTALASYYAVRTVPGRTPLFTNEVISDRITQFVGHGLTLNTIYTYLVTFTDVIPSDIGSILRAVFYGLGLVSVFVQSRRLGLGTLDHREKTWMFANVGLQVIFMISTLFLVGGLSLLVLAILGFVSGSRRLPLVPLVIFTLVLALLHNGKSQMRERYWDSEGNHDQPALLELPGFFAEWVEFGVTTVPGQEDHQPLAMKLLDRTSLFHLLCLVQTVTPEHKPFLAGDTYKGIPAQFVPRFFWPDKPLGHAATSQMSVYYGLQRMEDTAKTTIGFGMLIESYVNFGMFGIVAFGLAMGSFYKWVTVRCRNSPLLSYPGLYTVVLMAWSFQTEAPMSMWLSSMFQACVAVMGIPFILKKFFGR